jgi:MFS family permease
MRMPPRWAVAVSLAAAGTLPGDSLIYAVLPIVWSELGLELWMVGVLLSANRFVRLITNPIAGWLIARVGVRVPFVVAVFASSLTTAAYGLVSGFALFLLARALWGVCWSFLRLGGYLAVLGTSKPEHRGYSLGFYNGVAGIGTLFAVLFGGILTDVIGFRSTTFLFAAIALGAGVAMLRERPPRAGASPAALPESEDRDGDERIMAPARLASPRRRWAVYAAAFVTTAAGSGLALATLGRWLVELHGSTVHIATWVVGVASLNGALLAIRFAAGIFWAPAVGHLSDRHGRIRFMMVAGTLAVTFLMGLSLPAGLPWTVAMVVGLFLSGTALRVGLDAAAGGLAPPEMRSRVMSWYVTASDLGAAVGPFIAYPLATVVGLGWVYRGGAVCLAVVGLGALALILSERRAARGVQEGETE